VTNDFTQGFIDHSDISLAPTSHLAEVSRNDFARRYGDCLERGVDLVECGLSHCGILAPLGKEYQRDALVAKAAGPVQQHALAGSFCQRLAKGGDGLCERRLALSEVPYRSAADSSISKREQQQRNDEPASEPPQDLLIALVTQEPPERVHNSCPAMNSQP